MQTWQTSLYATTPSLACVDAQLRRQCDDARRAMALRVHACVARATTAALSATRRAALRELLQLLLDWNVQAAVTASHLTARTDANSKDSDSETTRRRGLPSPRTRVLPYDAIQADVMGTASEHDGSGSSNSSWDDAQAALSTRDYVAPLLDAALPPLRDEVRACMHARKPAKVVFASDALALQWCSLPHAAAANAAGDDEDATAAERYMTAVTLREQELVLRVLQGLFLCARYQRNCVVRSTFFYLVAQTLQCVQLHLDAAQRSRRGGPHASLSSSSLQQHTTMALTTTTATPAVYVATSVSQQRVLLAMLDAVAAACHYHPDAHDELVKSGALHAALEVVYLPYTPASLRARVLSMVSVLLQQVAPLLHPTAVSQVNSNSSNNTAAVDEVTASGRSRHASMAADARDDTTRQQQQQQHALLQAMLTHAVTGMTPNMAHHFPTYTLRRNSALRLEMHVTEWLSRRGLLHLLPAMTQLHRSCNDDGDDGDAGSRGGVIVNNKSASMQRGHADAMDVLASATTTASAATQSPQMASARPHGSLQRTQQLCQRRVVALLHAIDGKQATLL